MKKIKLSTKAVLSLGLSAKSRKQYQRNLRKAQGRRKPTQSRVQRAARKKARRIQQRKVRKTVRFPEMK